MRRIANLIVTLAALFACEAHADTFHTQNVIHQEMSLYRNIVVSDGDDHRCMTFGRFSGRQSCIQLSDQGKLVLRYTQGVLAALYVQPSPARILVVGLGGGMIPMALHRAYPDAQIDVVELDPAIVEVAQSYFGFRTDAKLHAFVEDGRMFVRKQGRAGTKYDIIVMDAFDKDYIPEHMLTVEFLRQVADILSPHGVVAANTFIGPLSPYETATYQAVFPSTCAVDLVGGNRIILARGEGEFDLARMAATGRSLDSRLSFTGVSAALLVPSLKSLSKAAGTRPLTDLYSPANALLKYEH